MAGDDLPDTLTPEQASRLGFTKKTRTLDMPDVLTPEQAQRLGLTSEPTDKIVGLSSTNAGPAARRAATLRPPGPREYTDEEVGVSSMPIAARHAGNPGEGLTDRFLVRPYGDEAFERRRAAMTPSERSVDDRERAANGAFLIGMIPAGTLGRIAGGATMGTLAPAAPRLAPIAAGAAEGATISKTMGGDPIEGMLLGGGLGAVGPLLNSVSARAAARTEARLIPDIKRGATKATGKVANDVTFKGNEAIAQVADELPEVGKALKTQARTNPEAAAKVTGKALDKLTDANDAAYAAIQRQHGGVLLKPIADRLAGLEERLNLQGRGVAADGVARVRSDLLKRYGDGADVKLSAQQIRNIRNDMGTVIDPQRTIKPNTRRQALSKVYEIMNKEIEDVAGDTRGVDVEAFKTRNRQISTLIPVRDALAQRVEKLADQDVSIIPGLKDVAKAVKKVGQRTVRGIDYRLSGIPAEEGAPIPASAAVPVISASNRDYAQRVSEGMAAGMSLANAVAAANGEPKEEE